ncbi:hypothetical protein BJX63DRAFT_413335 [Aspergillus granulosus]|uniref:Uncharacterized protein n=1 Tax=Aspergillus granulosus TaxID=176169 RepID=A0ABR4GV92_9EURO
MRPPTNPRPRPRMCIGRSHSTAPRHVVLISCFGSVIGWLRFCTVLRVRPWIPRDLRLENELGCMCTGDSTADFFKHVDPPENEV